MSNCWCPHREIETESDTGMRVREKEEEEGIGGSETKNGGRYVRREVRRGEITNRGRYEREQRRCKG